MLKEQRRLFEEKNLAPVPLGVLKLNAHQHAAHFFIEERMLVDDFTVEDLCNLADAPAKYDPEGAAKNCSAGTHPLGIVVGHKCNRQPLFRGFQVGKVLESEEQPILARNSAFDH